MKKKQANSRNIEMAPRSRKNSNSSNTGNAGVVKRRKESSNKQNMIQITEPFYSNNQAYTVKEFVQSKENVNLKSKSDVNDIDSYGNGMMGQKGRQTISKYDKEQELIDRRLSLKCTTNYSQNDKQKSQRLSMTPIRKEVNGISSGYPQSFVEERPSFSSINQQYLIHSDSKLRNQIKKEGIITNFVNKLEHQQDLRTIIQSKLRNNSSEYLSKDRKNQSNFSDFTEQSSNLITSKLKQCENQIKYLKYVICEMAQKTTDMAQLKKISSINQNIHEDNTKKSQNNIDLIEQLRKLGKECKNCQRYEKTSKRQMSTQTINNGQQYLKHINANDSSNFADNIDQTLQILDYRRY